MTDEIHYFITVDWCNKGKRGIFTSKQGVGFWETREHTEEEMREILGPFYLTLNPKSEPFNEEQFSKQRIWVPLAEYQHQYGIAVEVKE